MNTMFEFELLDYINGFVNGGIVGGAILAGIYSHRIKQGRRYVDPVLERSKKQLLEYAQKTDKEDAQETK